MGMLQWVKVGIFVWFQRWLKLLVCDGGEEKRRTSGPDYGGCCMDLLWILGQSPLVVVGLIDSEWLLFVDGGVAMVATAFLWMVV